MLTQEQAKQIFSYDETTGQLFWKERIHKRIRVGWEAGRLTPHGYRKVTAFGKEYYTHRVVWLYKTGQWPKEQLDHINGDRADNRYENLRECTIAENRQNQKKSSRNTSGFLGVNLHSCGKYRAGIGKKHLGLFNTAEEAYECVVKAKQELFPMFVGRM